MRFRCVLLVPFLLTALPLLADVAAVRELIRAGRFGEAVAVCERELKVAPRSAALHTLKGLALQASGDKPAALRALKDALRIDGKYEPALQGAAQLEFEQREFAAASRTLETLVGVHPGLEPAHAMLAATLFEQRVCDRAVPHFGKLRQLTPASRWQYGVCLLETGNWTDAAAQFAELLKLREHVPTRYNLGLALWSAKDFRGAIAALSPLEASADADAMRLLASAHEAAGDTPKALATLQKALQVHPGEEPLLIDLAVLCMDHKALDLGVEVVRAGIERMPGSGRLQTLLGVLRVRLGDMDGAKAAFAKAQAIAPETGLGGIGIASTLMQMGLAADAAALLREQIALHGADAKTELTLARAILMLPPSPAADRKVVEILQRVVQQEPRNAVARGLLGKALLQTGNPAKAAAELAEAIRLDPADRTSTYQLMTIHKRSGRAKEAAELARKVNELLAKEKATDAAGDRFKAVRDGQP